MHRQDWGKIGRCIAAIVSFQIIGGVLGSVTSQNVEGWYRGLDRSPLNPPDWAFGAAWSFLYLILSLSYWKTYESRYQKDGWLILALFSVHMIMNWIWTPLFFVGHALLASYLLILILIFTAAMVAYLLWPLSRWASLVFVPYIGWLIFAGHLSEFIWRHN
jgi:translocator protein